MGNDYYYIKLKPLRYEDKPYYLCIGNTFHPAPIHLKIFDSVENAVDWKYNELDDEAFRSIFPNHEISIERI